MVVIIIVANAGINLSKKQRWKDSVGAGDNNHNKALLNYL